MSFFSKAKQIENQVISIRRHLHTNPELGFFEFNTTAYIADILKEIGIESQTWPGKTGVVGLIRGDLPGKTIAVRADIDALPIMEETGLSYTSTSEGVMHACGHDAHAAILLGCGVILNKYKENLRGNVKLIFQPAEEKLSGARQMIEDGVLETPKVDAIIGFHVWPDLPTGTIGFKKGVAMASSDLINITIKGKGAHAAYPEKSIDPIIISAQLLTMLQTIVSRELPSVEPAVFSIGQISGGTAPNIIPDKVELSGIVRLLNNEIRKTMPDVFKRLVEGMVKTMRGSAEILYQHMCPAVVTDEKIITVIKRASEEVVGRDNTIEIEYPTMGSEDFAYYLEKVPGAVFRIGCYNEKKGCIHPLHSGLFNLDEDCLAFGMAVICETVKSLFDDF